MDIQNLLRIKGEEVVSVAAAKEAEEAVPVAAVEEKAEADLVAAVSVVEKEEAEKEEE